MPLLDVFWTMLWLFLWIAWFWLVVSVFGDIFRSDDLSGWGKAGWTLFTVFLPYLGVFVYLVVRGSSMHERSAQRAAAQERATRSYIRDVTGVGMADELSKLADLRARGVLTDEEFQAQKSRILAG